MVDVIQILFTLFSFCPLAIFAQVPPLLRTQFGKMSLNTFINFSDINFAHAAVAIVAAPTIWNIMARLEYRTHLLTKVAFNSKYIGCYLLAIYIFSFSLFRDFLFHRALSTQPRLEIEYQNIIDIIAYIYMAIGTVLVGTSMWSLGVTGTYLGDYFGTYKRREELGFGKRRRKEWLQWNALFNVV